MSNKPVLATINARLDASGAPGVGHVRRRVSRNEKATSLRASPRALSRAVLKPVSWNRPISISGRWYFWVDEAGQPEGGIIEAAITNTVVTDTAAARAARNPRLRRKPAEGCQQRIRLFENLSDKQSGPGGVCAGPPSRRSSCCGVQLGAFRAPSTARSRHHSRPRLRRVGRGSSPAGVGRRATAVRLRAHIHDPSPRREAALVPALGEHVADWAGHPHDPARRRSAGDDDARDAAAFALRPGTPASSAPHAGILIAVEGALVLGAGHSYGPRRAQGRARHPAHRRYIASAGRLHASGRPPVRGCDRLRRQRPRPPLRRDPAWRKAMFLPLADPTTGMFVFTFIALYARARGSRLATDRRPAGRRGRGRARCPWSSWPAKCAAAPMAAESTPR